MSRIISVYGKQRIGKRGTILLSNALLIDQLGFKKGVKFSVAKGRGSIILRKTE